MAIEPATFISDLTATRNYYTHFGGDEQPKKKPLKGKDMYLLNKKMRALLRGAMPFMSDCPKVAWRKDWAAKLLSGTLVLRCGLRAPRECKFRRYQ